MSREHTFYGTWEITECSLYGRSEKTGLEGIKFRLDEMGDIIWYNDLINPIQQNDAQKKKLTESDSCTESANTLFSCESFEIMEITSNGPGIVFGAYAGLSIEFKTNTYTPTDSMTLVCDEWVTLVCNRVKESQSAGQEMPFSLLTALYEGYFSDVLIKSTDNISYHVHSPILRLNGFECTTNYQSSVPIQHAYHLPDMRNSETNSENPMQSHQNKFEITISTTAHPHKYMNKSQNDLPNISLNPSSSNYLVPPSFDLFNFSPRLISNISSSFNCLTTAKETDIVEFPKKYPTSSSDSNLQSNKEDVFNFLLPPIDVSKTQPNSDPLQTTATMHTLKNPLASPYRQRSPSPFPSFDTPPSSPLTPVSVLYNLPSFMLSPILHWLYAECLPHSLDEETCEKLISIGESTPPLIKLVAPCRKYLTNLKIKKFVIDVIMDIHACLNKIISSINPSVISRTSISLCQIFKDGIREAAIGCVKLLQFCNIFVKDASNLTRYQRHEIIKYVRTRLPIFMSQFHQILQNIFGVLSQLTSDEKADLIVYLVPEIELSLEVVTNVIIEIKSSLEKMCKDLNPIGVEHCSRTKEKSSANNPTNLRTNSLTKRQTDYDALAAYDNPHDQQSFFQTVTPIVPMGQYNSTATSPKRFQSAESDLKFVLYMYEVKKMRDIYERITTALQVIQHKKLTFNEMTTIDKQRTIHRNLEQLILEMPSYIKYLEDVSDSIDEKIGWKEFKFCFKLATSQINGVISKLLDHKSALNDAVDHICKLVQRDQFTQAMIDLGLLEHNNILESEIKIERKPIDYNAVKLNLIRTICESPIAAQSSLSKNSLRLLHSGQLADMEFEIIYNPNGAAGQRNSFGILDDEEDDESKTQVHIFKAHRVIIASRCEWFMKALLSGMQEDINRKITIHDTSPVIFRRLLLYLYGAPIDRTVGVEQICELMLLADRYSVDELKDICETTLISLIDDDAVICLLGIADRFNATSLKTNCLSFISQHGHLTNSDVFAELPKILQIEVQDLLQWCGRVPEPWNNDRADRKSSSRHSLKSPSRNSKSQSRRSSPSFM